MSGKKTIKIQIKNRYDDVIYKYECEDNIIKKTVENAVDTGADLTGAYLTGAYLTGAYLTGADLTGADLTGADLTGAYLRDAYLTGAYLRGADLTGAHLTGAHLTGAYLTGAYLTGAYLTGADLTGAYLRDADLTGVDLTGADLTGAHLTDADLTGAYLRGAYLRDADLTGVDLTGADLTGAHLTDADLTGAYLTGADLTGAHLTGAYLRDAYLTGAHLTGAKIDSKYFYQIIPDIYLLKMQSPNTKLKAWKYLAGDGGSPMQKYSRIFYKVGKTYREKDCDTNELYLCSSGLNVATLQWCLKETCDDNTPFIEVEFEVKDIIAIPFFTDGKFRVKKLKVLRQITREQALGELKKLGNCDKYFKGDDNDQKDNKI